MFESPASTRPSFLPDPWSADYGSSLETEDEEEDEPGANSDPFVETHDWSDGILPEECDRPERIIFVDGVQRVDVWGRAPVGDTLVEAALASVAVGATVCMPGRASIQTEPVSRVFAASAGRSVDDLDVPLSRGRLLNFSAESSERGGRDGVLDAIRKRRSELERKFAESLVAADALVVQDGRLSFDPARATPVVGFAKTIHRFYLQDEQRQLLFRLGKKERSPVFRISYGDTTRYSWYLKLPNVRPIYHPLAGLVRLETPDVGIEAAVELANLASCHLPAFASQPQHDPRAPQNLIPIGGLERQLRHELGDARYIRRLIEDHISGRNPR